MYRTRVPAPTYPLRRPGPALSREEKIERMYALIEKLQRRIHRRESPEKVMDIARNNFPDPIRFVESGKYMLHNFGMRPVDAHFYAMIPDLARTYAVQSMGLYPKLNTVSSMASYLKTLYIGVHEELFYLVMLNNQGRLIYTRLLQNGNSESAPFYLRPVLSTALQEGAKYIVLAHNHPGGTLRPSKEDILCTLQVLNAVVHMHMPLLDHIIIARNRVVSIRETGLIPDVLWTAPAPYSKMLKNWNDREFLVDP